MLRQAWNDRLQASVEVKLPEGQSENVVINYEGDGGPNANNRFVDKPVSIVGKGAGLYWFNTWYAPRHVPLIDAIRVEIIE